MHNIDHVAGTSVWIVTWSVYLTPLLLLFAINHFIIFRTDHHLFKPSTRRRHHLYPSPSLSHSWWYGTILSYSNWSTFLRFFRCRCRSIAISFATLSIRYSFTSSRFLLCDSVWACVYVRQAIVGVVFISFQHFKFVGHDYSIICSKLCDCFEWCALVWCAGNRAEKRQINTHTNALETTQVLLWIWF